MATSARTLASFGVNPQQPDQVGAQPNNGLRQANSTQGAAVPQDTVTLSSAALAQAQTQALTPAAAPVNSPAQTQAENAGTIAAAPNAAAANTGTIVAPATIAGPGTGAPERGNVGADAAPVANAAPTANTAPAANTAAGTNAAPSTNAAAAQVATQAGGTTTTSQQAELAQLAALLQQLGINPASVSTAEQVQLLAYMNDPAALAQFVNGGVASVQSNNANYQTQPQNAGAAGQVQGLNVLA
jgi:hypothetical protein